MKKDIFKIANKKLNSRLIVGTGKYKSMSECAKAIKLSGAKIVTVAVRRVNILNKEELTTIAIYDVIGNKIKLLVNERKSIGHHAVEWDATNTAGEAVSGGMYFYTIESGSFKQTKKMIHLK